MRKQHKILIGLLAAAVALGFVYYWFNPSADSFAPKCVFHYVTGLSCPGCGMQRFLHAFMHGNFAEAIHYNYLLLILLPYLLFFGIERYILVGERQKRWRRVLEGRGMVIFMIVLAPSWFIIRNILHI